MKLLDFVLQNENTESMIDIKSMSKYYKIEISEYILLNYCPAYFDCLKNTLFSIPLTRHQQYKDDCRYQFSDDIEKCETCWNREI